MNDFLNKLIQKFKIEDLSSDSRIVSEKSIFISLKGTNFNGDDFLNDVILKGCKVIISENYISGYSYTNDFQKIFPDINLEENNQEISEYSFEEEILIIKSNNIKKILLKLLNIIYPKIPDFLVAVTGTNGKSSVVNYVREYLGFMDIDSASLGTLGVETSIKKDILKNNILNNENNLTTFDIISLKKILNNLKSENINFCALEASSIGLHQGRLDDIFFDIAVFTNFTQDHLDYHKTMANYLEAKLRLFKNHIKKDGIAIVNSEIAGVDYIKSVIKSTGKKILTVGISGDYKIKFLNKDHIGQNFSLEFNDKEFFIRINLLSKFQVYNVAISIAILHNLGFEIDQIIKHSHKITSATGRLQKISDYGIGSRIFVDYAHTPDALENVLSELKDFADNEEGRLITIFGCGGNRDSDKRPKMGKIALNYSDIVIITDDNPRNEDPQKIRDEIMDNNDSFIEIPNRKDAIFFAIKNMQKKDVLLIAGKGHEEYQIIGNEKFYFSDVKTAINIVANLKK